MASLHNFLCKLCVLLKFTIHFSRKKKQMHKRKGRDSHFINELNCDYYTNVMLVIL